MTYKGFLEAIYRWIADNPDYVTPLNDIGWGEPHESFPAANAWLLARCLALDDWAIGRAIANREIGNIGGHADIADGYPAIAGWGGAYGQATAKKDGVISGWTTSGHGYTLDLCKKVLSLGKEPSEHFYPGCVAWAKAHGWRVVRE